MSNLLDEAPEAKDFLEEVVNNIDEYKLFEGENFEHFLTGIIATTGVDSQGDRITLQAITQMAEQLNQEVIWNQAEHNPLIQPIGRSIAARLFYAPKSDTYFIAAVSGIYSPNLLLKFEDIGVDLENLPLNSSIENGYHPEIPQAQLAFSRTDFDQDTLDELLKEHPRLLDSVPDHRVRKAADPLTIIEVVASIWLLTSNPFSQAFLKKFGEKAAEEVLEFFGWLKQKVIHTVEYHANKQVLFEFSTSYKGCWVEFVTTTKDRELLIEATDSVNEAALSAVALIDRIEYLEPNKLVYEFDNKTRRWFPLHAATKRAGVITDRPVLVALDRYKAFSISGRVIRSSIVE